MPAHNHALTPLSSGKRALPGAIDGAVTPQLIPDSTAYRVYFRFFTADADQARQNAMLHMARFSAADQETVDEVGAYFQSLRTTYMQSVATAAAAARASGTPLDQTALATQEAAIGTQVKALLASKLSSAGMSGLDALVHAAKRNITIFPLPNMTGAK